MEHEERVSGTLTSLAYLYSAAALKNGLSNLFLLTLWAVVLLVGLILFLLPRKTGKFLGRRTVIIAMMLSSKIFDIFPSYEDNSVSLVALGRFSNAIIEAVNLTSSTTKPPPSTKQANGQTRLS
jgi:hypothetical protein